MPPGVAGAGIHTGTQAVLDNVVAQMSNWDPNSDISRFNRSRLGTWHVLPAAFLDVLRAGLDLAALSDGAFDPAIGKAINHWGFGPSGALGSAAHVPDAWRAIEINGNLARRRADVALDFSGIAKGYGVDAVAEWLMARGVTNFLVEVGGELRGEGARPDGQPWWVDIESVPGLAVPPTRVALCGLAAATSGDYRRFRVVAGQRLCHSIDPRSGKPICNNVAAVTVLHPAAMLADAWATALTILGQNDGMTLAARNNIAAVMITRQAAGATEAYSPAFAAMLA